MSLIVAWSEWDASLRLADHHEGPLLEIAALPAMAGMGRKRSIGKAPHISRSDQTCGFRKDDIRGPIRITRVDNLKKGLKTA
jgi:hypothetical protein